MSTELNIATVKSPLYVGYGTVEYWNGPTIISIGGRQPCYYCGNLLDSDIPQCPGCGARDWSRIAKR